MDYTDSGVEVYVDENFEVPNPNTEPTCKEGWSIFGQVSMKLISIVLVLKDHFQFLEVLQKVCGNCHME